MLPRAVSAGSRLRTAVVCAVLFVGTLLLFSRSIGHGFVNYDDPRYVSANPHVQAPFGWHSITWAFTARAELWQPLTWFSHMLDWQLFGEDARGHHATSVLWHAVNAVLAFAVMRRATGAFWLSAFAAALFAWHPLRVESVAWVAERKDVMSGCFFLLTWWSYLIYAAPRARSGAAAAGPLSRFGSPRAYALTLACFAASLLCKPTAVTLPLVLLAVDAWLLRRTAVEPGFRARAWRIVLIEKLPFFALSLTASLVTIVLQNNMGMFTLELPLGARLANAPIAVVRYVGKFVWPAALSVSYPHPGWWPPLLVIGAILVVGGVSVIAWRTRATQPWVAVGWAWFLALLLPTIGIVQVGFQSLADRYTYLPFLGLVLAVLETFRATAVRWVSPTFAGSAAILLLGATAARTWQQQAVWQDSLRLFTHAVAVTGPNATGEAFLGYTLASLGRDEEAAQHSQRALALDPRNEMAVFTLAEIDAAHGRLDAAIAGYQRSLTLKPEDGVTHFELGLVLLRAARVSEAASHLQEAARLQPTLSGENARMAWQDQQAGRAAPAAVRYLASTLLEPDNAAVHLSAGAALARLGRPADALSVLRRAVALQPNLPDAQVELGLLLLNEHELDAAAAHFTEALRQQPQLASAQVGLGRVAEQQGRVSEADESFLRALAVAPEDPEVARAWADVLARRGRFSEATRFYQRAVTLRPNDASYRAALGYALFLTGRRMDALAAWREALRLNPNLPGLRERIEKATQ